MHDTERTERTNHPPAPFTAADAAGMADALRRVAASLRAIDGHAGSFRYGERDEAVGETARHLLRHAGRTVHELVGQYRAYTAGAGNAPPDR